MSLHFTPLSLIAIALAMVALAVAVYSWRMRDTFGSVPLLLLALIAAGWSLAYGLEVASTTVDLQTVVGQSAVDGFDIGARAVAGLCRAQARATGRLSLGAADGCCGCCIPALVLLLAWTNEWHGLVWSDSTAVRSRD